MTCPASLAQFNHSSHSPSIQSLSSNASAAVGHAKKALSSLKTSVQKVLHPKKKAQTEKFAEDTDCDNDESDEAELEHLQATWCSPVYSFFKPKVEISYEGKHKNEWMQEWINMALKMVCEKWEKYKDKGHRKMQLLSLSNVATDDDVGTDFGDIAMDDINDQVKLKSYLTQLIENVVDPIEWWYNYCAAFP
ncbi:hypothetical protein H0H87_012607 [Tephrocybe sp. NHM501043]|nr:hypothetical protein H0H87_012607 [Tephrocybe sp. NHM501043]